MRRTGWVVVVLAVLVAGGCDWNMFANGSTHTGSTSTETAIGPANVGTITQRWATANVTGTGAPVESHGVVFDKVTGGIRAFDSATGAVLWTASTHGSPSAPSAVNGVVYAGSADASVYAFDATTGAQLWRRVTVDDAGAPTVAGHLVYVATMDNGSIATSPDEQLYALDAATGAVVWSRSIGPGGAVGDPAAPTVGNGTVFVGSYDGLLRAFNAANGQPVWTVNVGKWVDPTVAYVSGHVYATAFDLGLYSFDATNGHLIWFTPVSGVQNPTSTSVSLPTVADGTVFVSYNGYTGQSPTVALFRGSAAFDAATGALRWRTGFQATISVANGVAYLAGDGGLRAFDAADGSVLKTVTGLFDGFVAISNNRVLVDGGGSLHVYGLPPAP